MIEFHYFARSCPNLPTPFVGEAIFMPFYASAPFVKYELTIETWVYFWPLCSILLIHVSVLMPGCFDKSCSLIFYVEQSIWLIQTVLNNLGKVTRQRSGNDLQIIPDSPTFLFLEPQEAKWWCFSSITAAISTPPPFSSALQLKSWSFPPGSTANLSFFPNT